MKRFKLLLPVYVPTLLLSLGQGVLLPTLPLYAKSLGISFALVSMIVGAAAIGTLAADLPSGVLLERVGRRPAMLFGCGSVALTCFLAPLFPNFGVLFVLQFILGVGTSLWGISRHVFLADSIPPEERGRALSSFGGIMRIGTFGGPAIGGIVGDRFGLAAPFLVSGALSAAALLISYFFIPESTKSGTAVSTGAYLRSLGRVVVDNRSVLTSAGFAQLCTQMIRAGRQVIVPLYAAYALNLDVAAVGSIISISSAIDMFLFIPAGLLMDRMGRKAAIIPCFIILSVGMAMVPLSTGYASLLVATTIMGFGNGIGSGTMMTLGADLAPPASIGAFLGVWRLIGDVGGAGGPVVVGGVADLIGLAASAYALAAIGMLAVVLFALTVPETGKKPHLEAVPVGPAGRRR
jgi:MFS family permease